jgi:hypothetical protein
MRRERGPGAQGGDTNIKIIATIAFVSTSNDRLDATNVTLGLVRVLRFDDELHVVL